MVLVNTGASFTFGWCPFCGPSFLMLLVGAWLLAASHPKGVCEGYSVYLAVFDTEMD